MGFWQVDGPVFFRRYKWLLQRDVGGWPTGKVADLKFVWLTQSRLEGRNLGLSLGSCAFGAILVNSRGPR